MEWLKELSIDELKKELRDNGDMMLVIDACGLDTFCSLVNGGLVGMSIYLGGKPLFNLKRFYIRKHFNGSNVKELAKKLGVTERFVYYTVNPPKQCRDKKCGVKK